MINDTSKKNPECNLDDLVQVTSLKKSQLKKRLAQLKNTNTFHFIKNIKNFQSYNPKNKVLTLNCAAAKALRK